MVTKPQSRAIKQLVANKGGLARQYIPVRTGNALIRQGLVTVDRDGYRLTDKGWALYRNELAPKVEVKVGKVEWSFEITSD